MQSNATFLAMQSIPSGFEAGVIDISFLPTTAKVMTSLEIISLYLFQTQARPSA